MDTKHAKTVLVLGAYGEAGKAVVRALAAQGLMEVVGAGRDEGKLSRLQAACEGISTVRLDVSDRAALDRALSEVALVVNCVGPFIGMGLDIARAAIAAKVPCIDIASEQQHFRGLLSLDDDARRAGVPILTGAGAYPGLSGLLLKALLDRDADADACEMALVTGPHADASAGSAQAVSGLVELAYDLEARVDGQLRAIVPGARRDFAFPEPFGTRTTMRWPQMEILAPSVAGRLRSFETFVALGGEPLPARPLLRMLKLLQPRPGSRALALLQRVARRRHARARPQPGDQAANRAACLVRVSGNGTTQTASIRVHDVPGVTAWLPAHAAKQWALGRLEAVGVLLPMDALDPAEVLAALTLAEAGRLLEVDGLG